MNDCLLGMDFGTGGAKAVLINDQADILSYAYREYPILTDRPGWSEHDADQYWPVACELIRECVAKAGVDPRHIRGIGTSSALPSMVMVDRNDAPVHRAYNLMDRRATAEVDWLKRQIGEDRIFGISGNRLDDHPLLVNLLWERNHRPDTYASIRKILTIDGYIRLKLTGEATMHRSAGAFYGVAYNLAAGEFDTALLKELGIDPDLIPTCHDCKAVIGSVTEKAASETGLVPGIPVVAGQVDCNAGWPSRRWSTAVSAISAWKAGMSCVKARGKSGSTGTADSRNISRFRKRYCEQAPLSIPEGLDPVYAAVSEPVSSCLNEQEKGQVGLGDTVVIIGSGPIGCIHVALARACGATRVIVADVFADRLKLCEPFGPDYTIHAGEVNLVDEVRRLTDGKGVDVVITANPVPETQVQALEMARKGGRILLFGGLPHDRSRPGLDTNLIHYRGLQVIGTTTFAPRHHRQAIAMMASGRLSGEKLVTDILPLTSFDAGVAKVVAGKALKVVFIP